MISSNSSRRFIRDPGIVKTFEDGVIMRKRIEAERYGASFDDLPSNYMYSTTYADRAEYSMKRFFPDSMYFKKFDCIYIPRR